MDGLPLGMCLVFFGEVVAYEVPFSVKEKP
jgi:hypothetical protein